MGTPPDSRGATFDRQFWLALLVAALVLIPRTALISRAHSEYWDDQFHLSAGLSFLAGTDALHPRNDPPLGQMILSLPVLVFGHMPEPLDVYWQTHADSTLGHGSEPFFAVLYDQPVSPETLSLLLAIWKAILFLPGALLVFHWSRTLYGVHSAWLALAMVLIDPTIAGHVAPVALDLLGAEAILFACYLTWRYFESPGGGRMLIAGVATAFALLVKHTAIILPAVAGFYALSWYVIRRNDTAHPAPLRHAAAGYVAFLLVAVLAIWPLTLFDVSPPAGVYVGSIAAAREHAASGHPAYLLGRHSLTGWWTYYPVVAWYKVPIGIGFLLLLGLLSLRRIPARRAELPLAIAAVSWAVFLCAQNINIGFRHVLPAYLPVLLLTSRVLAAPSRGWMISAWVALAVAGVHVLSFHPDYLSYVNFPRPNAHLAISDSNLDWGQSLKQVRAWIDTHPQPGRDIFLAYFGNSEERSVDHYLRGKVRRVNTNRGDVVPRHGILIVSPVYVVGAYASGDPYRFIREAEARGEVKPLAIIGHCMRVYDLDAIGR